ncbi:MAG TPA: hypothetical protein VGH87_04140 [Polyangiaceae bacterium]|jgi:hypothetical protein|nr:hypothetical protein [Polyangiaceae bacterium]
MIRHAAVLAIAVAACAPQARSPTFRAAPQTAQTEQQKPHTHISKGGAAGLAILGAVLVGFAGVAIFVVPRTGGAG